VGSEGTLYRLWNDATYSPMILATYATDESWAADHTGVESTATLVGALKVGWAAMPATNDPAFALTFEDNPYAELFP
jgi:hypothetical protein